ncbi:MAG: trypsin-like peptidase domain-containing protein [Euryarchaeota archaeon]|nr:trypsin-like peptidase domain-containing protein [Euryarchaeota archaeon]
MNEINTIEKKRGKAYIALFVTIFIVSMFIAGYLIGGTLSYSTTASSETKQLQQQLETQQKSNNAATQNIIYVYNDTSLAQLYQNVRDSVVVIYGLAPQQSFFGTQYAEVQGSGFVYEYNNENIVITNKHVVDGASDITVTFSNGNAYPATVLGSDDYSDLAVLSVQAPVDEYHPLEIVSSSTLNVGEPVIAIGSPFGLGGTMTTGIVSQLGRTIQDSVAGNFLVANIIQTSVPINPGNSGGPLLNYQGDIVGITTAIIQNSNGLGFAIPSNTILREIQSLVTTGSYDQHSWLGISGADMKYSIAQAMNINVTYGWLITQVTSGGAADNAGLKGGDHQVRINGERTLIGGDIIIAIDGTRIINGDFLMSYLEEYTIPNQIITVTIVRNSQILDISIQLGTRPAST